MTDCGQAIVDDGDGVVSPRTWYLIHHCTSGKFRVIIYGATGLQSMSINDCLFKDPQHTGNLLGSI